MTTQNHIESVLGRVVSGMAQRFGKPAMFAVLGAVGCLVGALFGEVLAQVTERFGELKVSSVEVCLLIDCSGSMKGGKLEEVSQAALAFARRQDLSRNPMAVVAFAGSVTRLVGVTTSLSEVEQALNRLSLQDYTAMDKGLIAAHETLAGSRIQSKQGSAHAILLFTDGEPTDSAQVLGYSDIKDRTRAAAEAIRKNGMVIVAVGTGDANVAFLQELTGNESLVFFASQGGFDDAFRKAEKEIYTPQMIGSSGLSYSLGITLLRNVGWCVLAALGLTFLLWGGQNAYLHRPILSAKDVRSISGGGALAGIAAGLLALGAFTLLAKRAGRDASELMNSATYAVAWGVLGALLGRGMAGVIPNLERQAATKAGAIGGVVAGLALLLTAHSFGLTAARLLSAAILGAAVGYAIALAEEKAREASLVVHWGPNESATLSLGVQPVLVGSGKEVHVYVPREKGFPAIAGLLFFREGKVEFEDKVANQTHVIRSGSKIQFAGLTLEILTSR